MGKAENAVTDQTRKRLNAMDVWHFKHWAGMYSGLDGISDLIGIKTMSVKELTDMGVEKVGVFVAIELKAPGAKTNKERMAKQKAFLANVEDRGGIGIMSNSPAEVEELLTNHFALRKE